MDVIEKDWLDTSWKLLVLRGVLGMVFGVVAMIWPVETVVALAVLWGIWALVDGIGAFVQAFQRGTTGGGRAWLLVMGAIGVLAGLYAVLSPVVAAAALTWVLGIWLLVRGLLELFGGFSSTREMPRWLLFLSGGLSVLLGILFMANPGRGSVAIAVWLGVVALLWGVFFLIAGFLVRRELHGGSTHRAVPA